MNGQVQTLGAQGAFIAFVEELDGEGLKLDQLVDITPIEDARTISQNRLYWRFIRFALKYYKIIDPAINPENLHERFKIKILGFDQIVMGEHIRIYPSTTTLTVRQFCDYFENCFALAIEEAQVPVNLFQEQYDEWKAAMMPQEESNVC